MIHISKKAVVSVLMEDYGFSKAEAEKIIQKAEKSVTPELTVLGARTTDGKWKGV